MRELPPPPLWQRSLGTLGGVFLGLVLLVAAWAKILDPGAFVEQIRVEGLDFLLPASAVAFVALALEVGLGSALVLGLRRLWVLIPSSLLVGFFLWLAGRNYWLTAKGLRSAEESCGCFGNLVERTPAEAFWQDLFLLVPSLLLAFLAWRWGSRRWLGGRVAVVLLLTIAGLVVAWKAPELPLDDLATRLRPGVEVANLCQGEAGQRICFSTLVPELGEGRHLVILADLEDSAFGEAVEALNARALTADAPRLWVVTASPSEALRAFFWQWGPSFEIREAPAAVLRPLYRRLPRSFIVENGRVTRTFPGLPPFGA
ncbi:MAG: hypothetical protein KDD47_04105 [Acidobacteria bacterium]|nr:hypothetical protein [Acidobacteriota bacterium]